jgi:hypothetical protein
MYWPRCWRLESRTASTVANWPVSTQLGLGQPARCPALQKPAASLASYARCRYLPAHFYQHGACTGHAPLVMWSGRGQVPGSCMLVISLVGTIVEDVHSIRFYIYATISEIVRLIPRCLHGHTALGVTLRAVARCAPSLFSASWTVWLVWLAWAVACALVLPGG